MMSMIMVSERKFTKKLADFANFALKSQLYAT